MKNKLIVFIIVLCSIGLPACKQVPRIKSVPTLSKNEYRLQSSSSELEAFAQPLTKDDARPFLGFTPKPKEFGQAWLVTINNTSESNSYNYYNNGWSLECFENDLIIARFNRAYKYHFWGIAPLWIPTLGLITPMTFFFGSFCAIGGTFGPAPLVIPFSMYLAATGWYAVGLAIPASLIYYTYRNNRTYDFSMNQLHSNLIPEAGTLLPKHTLTGLVFLPVESINGWHFELENTTDYSKVIQEYKNQ